MRILKKIAGAFIASALLFLAACSGPETNVSTASDDLETMADEDHMEGMDHGEMEMLDAMGDGLQVIELYGRAAPAVQPTGAFYMRISNGTDTDEVLQSASVELCGTIELHEMKMDDDVMIMQEVPGSEILIPAGKTVALEPGGLHVMCIEKEGELVAGDSISVTLNFARAGSMTLDAEIREVDGGMSHDDEEMEGMDHGDS